MAKLPDGWVLDDATPAAPAPSAPAASAKLPDGWSLDEAPQPGFVPVPTPRPASLDGPPTPPARPGQGDLPADLNAPAPSPSFPTPPQPQPQPEAPGMLDTILQAGRKGLVTGLTDTANVIDPFKERPQEGPKDAVDQLLQTPMANGWRNSKWWAAHIANGFAASSPTLAMTAGGAMAGGLTAGPAGALAGGMGGGAIGAAMQTLAPAYAKARQDGLSHDDAVNRAIDETGIAAVFGAGMAGAPELKVFGKDALGAVKKPISEALAQIFGVQPGLMAGQKVAENAREGKPLTDDVAQSLATGIATGAVQAGVHAGAKAIPKVLPEGMPGAADPNQPNGPNGPVGGGYDNVEERLRTADRANRQKAQEGSRESYEFTTKDGKKHTATPTDPDVQDEFARVKAAQAAKEAQRQQERPAEEAAQQKAAEEAAARKAAQEGQEQPAAPGVDDTGQNMPESKATLQAQQDQLVNGDRRAQMFPAGTDELPLPKGMKRVETPRGVFHYDPSKISADEIKQASAQGRENDILDLGPNSKADVDAAAAQGDPRVNVTERGPNGEEVKTSTATEGTANAQAETMEATKTEGNTVQKEPLDKTIIERENATLRAMGWADSDIGKMSPLERQAQLQEAHESGITANDEPTPQAEAPKGDGTRKKPVNATEPEHVDQAAAQAAEPTPAQAEAGNYKKGHVVTVDGLPVAIETPKGATRRSKPGQPKWEVQSPAHYGYIKGTKGADGDPVDIYIGPTHGGGKTFVVDQHDPQTGKFDEHKVITGVDSLEEAVDIYNRGFSDGSGPSRMGAVTETNADHLKDWLANGDTRRGFGQLPEKEAPLPPGAERENLFDTEGDPSFLKNMSAEDRAAFDKGNPDNQLVAKRIGKAIDRMRAENPNHPRLKNLEGKLQGVLDAIMPNRDTSRRPQESWQDEMRRRHGQSGRAGDAWEDIKRKAKAAADAAQKAHDDFKAHAERQRQQQEEEIRKRQEEDRRNAEAHRKAVQEELEERERAEKPEYRQEQAERAAKGDSDLKDPRAPWKDDLRRKGWDEKDVEDVQRRAEAIREEAAKPKAEEPTDKQKAFMDAVKAAQEKPARPRKPESEKTEREKEVEAGIGQAVRDALGKKGEEQAKPKGQTRLGKNHRGNQVYEDENGVRSYVEKGIRVTEPVGIIPGGGISVDPSKRGRDFKTAEELGGKPTAKTADERDPVNEIGSHLGAINSGGMVPAGTPLMAFLNENGLVKGPRKAFATGQGLKLTDEGERVYDAWNGYGEVPDPAIVEMADRWKAMRDAAEEAPPVDTAEAKATNKPAEGTGESNADDGAGVRSDAPGVSKTEQPAVAGEPPEQGGADGLLGEGGSGRGADVRDSARADDARADAPEGVSRPGKGARGDTRDGGRDRQERPDLSAAADAGRVEAEKGLADRARRNYVIDPNAGIGDGGAKQKVRQNLDAIRIVKELLADQRDPTVEEKDKLARYVGWGAFAQKLFDPDRYSRNADEWKAERTELRSLLSDEEYAAARASTLNAHYTSVPVIQGMWKAAESLGYRGGRALEPSSGVGSFIGLTPEGLRGKTMWTAVELDPITGNIAKALYGGADVNVKGFQDLVRPDNYFDLAISNVPFGSYGIRDTRYGRPDLLIHDYFFVKSLDKVRPGGMVAFITSAGTMNKAGDRARMMIQERADLMGAIRLPGGKKGAFAGNAGTEVTTDILFLRKRAPGEAPSKLNPWMGTTEVQTAQGPTTINEYFAAHPEHVLGTHALTGTMYRADSYTVEPFEGPQDYSKLIADAVASFPQELHMVPRAAKTAAPKEKIRDVDTDDLDDGVKEGGFYEKKGKLYRRENGLGREVDLKGPDAKKVRALIGMRDLVNKLLASQATGKIEGNDAARKELKKQYAAFVKAHGPINLETHTVTSRLNRQGENIVITKMPNFNAFRGDPDAYKVAAIEDYDSESQTARPAAIMERDIVGVPTERKIESPADALAASLEAHGGINEAYVARTLGIDVEGVEKALGDLVFRDPNGDRLVPADEYLSGDVVQKLEEAHALADVDPRMKRNIEALKKVQPTPLRPDEITAQFGAPWIPEDVYKHFIESVLGGHGVKIKRQVLTAEWNLEARGFAPDARAKFSTDRVGLEEVLKAALNLRRLSVYDNHSDGTRTLNAEATRLANVKLDELRDAFTGNDESGTEPWVWKDPARMNRLAAIYNRQFNSTVLRKFDGSHLTFPGMASVIAGSDGKPVPFSLRPHQKNAVWRALQRGNTLFDHVVGAGKTFTMVATGMEGRRLGLYRKPAYVVPNHMLEQFSREFLQAYPGAKLLVAQKDEMTKDARRAFAAKASTGDWDGIIITHDAFGRINMSPEWQAQHIAKQVAQMEDLIREMHADRGSDKRTVKQIENAKIKLQARIKDLMNVERKDQGVTFEEMGIDHLFVDEAHLFKNLSFVTKMTRVKGLSQGNSQRAEDMYLKLKWLEQNKPGRSAVFATGTPISNTIAEMYTMQRYLQEPRLAQMGLDKFDSWAATFGQTQENTELSADGRSMKTVTSFSRFVNIPELVGMYAEIADTQTADMLNLPRPQLAKNERGERGVIAVKSYPSPEEEALIQSFVERAANMKGPAVKGGDNMLKVVTDGRKVATDGRLYDPNLPFNPEGKIAKAVENIMKHYKGAKAPALAQIVFLDMGTPKPPQAAKKAAPSKTAPEDDFGADEDPLSEEETAERLNLYEDLRQRLIGKGIPKSEIAFIHEATDDRKKAVMFEKTRRGEIRVLVGSTGKMGVGTNVQRMLVAMHHIDAPYKPAEVEQRDGRGIRQGNLNPEISIYRYVTERSFDAFMWQKLDTKSRFIAQLKSGAKGVRSAEDIDNPLPEAAEMKAAASGDPRIMEEANLKRQVMRLETQRKSFLRTKQELEWRKKETAERIAHLEKTLPAAEALAAKLQDVAGDKFVIDLSGLGLKKPIHDRAEAGEAIKQFFTTDASKFMGREAEGIRLGNYGGMELYADAQRTWTDDGYSTTIQPYVKAPAGVGSGRYATRQRTFINETSDLGAFTRQLDTILGDVRVEPGRIKASIEHGREDLARMQSESSDAAWPREAEYQTTVKKLKDVQAALKAKAEEATKPKDQPKPEDMASGLARGHNGGPTLDDLTPHAREHIDQIVRDVNEIVGRVAGNHANALKFEKGKFALSGESMKNSTGQTGHLAAGAYTSGLRLIRIALGVGGERTAAYHESMHALERGGAFTPLEQRVLEGETPRLRERIRRKYRVKQEHMDNITDEEVRAYSFEDYAGARDAAQAGAGVHVGVRRVFEKVKTILNRIRNYLAGRGFHTAEDVFKKAYDGEMGERPARGDGAGMSAAEVRAHIRENGLGARFNMEDLAAGMSHHPNGARRHFADESIGDRIARKYRQVKAEAGTYIKEKFQDYSQRMLDKQRAVQEAKGGAQLPQTMRFYDQKRLAQAKTKAKIDEFLESHIQPLLDVMKEEGLTRQDVAEYAFAKHAPERNAEMDRRDPNNNGAGSGKTDAEAADMLNNLGPNIVAVMDQRVAPLLDRIREFNLDTMVRGGLLSQEQADEWRERFPNYVGLQGFEDADLAPDEGYFREGRKFGVFGKESKVAFGRNGTMSGDPFVNLVQQSMRTIDRVERNKVGMAAWRAFRSLPSHIRDDLGVRLDEGDSMKVLDPKTGLMQWRTNSPTADMSRVYSLKIGGQPHHIVFDDARVAEAFNRMGADQLPVVFKQIKGAVDVAKSLWTHYVPDFAVRHFGFRYPIEAVLNAGEFGGRAMGRAFKGLPGGAPMRAILKAEKLDAAGRAQVAQRFNAGTATASERWQHYYIEAKKAGAVMDLNALADLDSIKRYVDQSIAKLSTPGQRADGAIAQAKAVHMAWDRVLRAMDNAHRLVQYVDARERGEDVTSAALKARDATIDFSLRGQLANWINLWWPFGNTAIQTSARMLGAIGRKSPKFLAYSMGGSFAAGMLSAMFNYLFGGEDENGTPNIENVPEYVRRLNMSIILPGTHDQKGAPYTLTIPLPYNYAMPFALGQVAAHGFMKAAGYAKESTGKMIGMATHAILEGLIGLPQENSIVGKVMPAATLPLMHIYGNQTFYGAPLYTEYPKKGLARAEQGRPNTSELWKGVARMANEWSGGSRYESGWADGYPEAWREGLGFFTSGLERFATKGVRTASAGAKGSTPFVEDIPLLNTLLKSSKTYDQEKTGAYFHMRDEITARAKAYDQAVKDGNGEEANRLMQKYGPQIGAHDVLGRFEQALREINKARGQLAVDTRTPDADKERIRQELDEQTKSIRQQARKVIGELVH